MHKQVYIELHSAVFFHRASCFVLSKLSGGPVSSFSKVKYPLAPSNCRSIDIVTISVPALAAVRIVGSIKLNNGRSGRIKKRDMFRIIKGVLVRSARESVRLPGLIAIAVIFLKCEFSGCRRINIRQISRMIEEYLKKKAKKPTKLKNGGDENASSIPFASDHSKHTSRSQ